ncbi:MAG: 16S rRNA (uracil(1498)-N(3))-methyltransferase [Bacteroidales bacterium]|jgi:16S rRNA (uracil1498-N3)-methyltransferase|nr:16S rRNA (uracil(1498)-N(3))-methyltransferase [Bacteroidales bacterium]
MPFFFQENLFQDSFTLSLEESRHITKSMRLKENEIIWITDGKGTLVKTVLINVNRDCCIVEVKERIFQEKQTKKLHLAVAPTKNADRMEWLVEKAVEIGVDKISFIFCERSERKHIDLNRLHRVAVAALKQSQGTWLPEIQTNTFSRFIGETTDINADKFVAYCGDRDHATENTKLKFIHNDIIFMIGPEGDFTSHEVLETQEKGFQIVSLGNKILRTETAALLVACWVALNK